MKWEGGVEGTETHVPVLYVLEFELVVGALRYDGSAEGLYDFIFFIATDAPVRRSFTELHVVCVGVESDKRKPSGKREGVPYQLERTCN